MKKVLFCILMVILCTCLCSCGVCETCEGTQTEQCTICSDGKVTCSETNCKNGEMLFCNICSADNPDITFNECSICDGTGSISVDCDTCEGKGYITNPFTWEKFECGSCDGTAKTDVSCEQCHAVGYRCDGEKTSSCTGRCYFIDCSKCENGKTTCPACLGKKEHPCSMCCVEEYEYFKTNAAIEFDASAVIETTETILSGVEVQFEQGPDMGLKNIEITPEILNEAKTTIAEAAKKSDAAKALFDEIEIAEKFVNSSWETVSGDTQAIYDASDEIKSIDMTVQYDKVKHHFAITFFIWNTSGGGSRTLPDIYYLENTTEELMHNYYSGKTVTEQNGNLIIKDIDNGKYIELQKIN